MANNEIQARGRVAESMSKRKRPATSGNKNLQSRARRKGNGVPESMIARTHKGPDLGTG